MTRSVAFVSQAAWIQNVTLKANVLFGRAFVSEKYKQVGEQLLPRDIWNHTVNAKQSGPSRGGGGGGLLRVRDQLAAWVTVREGVGLRLGFFKDSINLRVFFL